MIYTVSIPDLSNITQQKYGLVMGFHGLPDLPTSNQAWFALTLLCFIQI